MLVVSDLGHRPQLKERSLAYKGVLEGVRGRRVWKECLFV